MKKRWEEIAAAKPSTVTSIDIGIRSFTAITVRLEPLELIRMEQFDLAERMELKNGKDPANQMKWVEGLIALFDAEPEAFSGDLIAVEEQLKRGAMGHRMCQLADITLTYWRTKGRQVTTIRPRSVHVYFAEQDATNAAGHAAILREKGYAGNKARASHWLKGILSEQHYKLVRETATKQGKDDDIGDALRQAVFAAHKIDEVHNPQKKQRKKTATRAPAKQKQKKKQKPAKRRAPRRSLTQAASSLAGSPRARPLKINGRPIKRRRR